MIQYDIVEVFVSRLGGKDTNHIGPFSDSIMCEAEAKRRIAGYKHTGLVVYIAQRNPVKILRRLELDNGHVTVSSGVKGDMIEKYDL